MGFEGEFAQYEPLRRLRESEAVKDFQLRYKIRVPDEEAENFRDSLIRKESLEQSFIKPDLLLAFDGSMISTKAENGFPGAEIGYITVASVLIDLKLVKELEENDFIDPVAFRETEKVEPIDSVFPGCNVILDNEKSAKSSLRRCLFEQLKRVKISFSNETLLDTYEYLFKIKREKFKDGSLPKSPLEDIDKEMTYGYGVYECPHTKEALYSTDALRLHELMKPAGSNGEMFGQIMSTIEKLWLIHVLRAFESRGWLSTLRRVAFIIDGPLAVFSTSSWLTKSILYEISRINSLQKKINQQDILIVGVEKSGAFYNHFIDIDTEKTGGKGRFPRQSAMLLDDKYIKRNIIFSESTKPYGQDTYFGRKFFYKTETGYNVVPVVACFNDYQQNIISAHPDQFSRLGDVMNLLDQLVSNRYPNSISPLISAHAQAAIPLNLGKKIFEEIATKIKENTGA